MAECLLFGIVLGAIALVAIVVDLRSNVARLRRMLAELSDRVDKLSSSHVRSDAPPAAVTDERRDSPVAAGDAAAAPPLSPRAEALRRILEPQSSASLPPASLENAVSAARGERDATVARPDAGAAVQSGSLQSAEPRIDGAPASPWSPASSASLPTPLSASLRPPPPPLPSAAENLRSIEEQIGVRWPVWLFSNWGCWRSRAIAAGGCFRR